MLLEQLYYMYYNIKPKTAPKGVTIMCFHMSYMYYYFSQILFKELAKIITMMDFIAQCSPHAKSHPTWEHYLFH